MVIKVQALPSPSYPFVGPDGKVSQVWYQYLASVQQALFGGSSSTTVQSITINSGSGIDSTVTNTNGAAVINLTLGSISPLAINCEGSISGTIGSFSQGFSNFGQMQFGAYSAGVVAATGTIAIVDIDGTTRQLLAR